MREILFRGKTVSREWEYGVPVFSGLNNELAFMKQMHSYDHQVIPETIGQFTGLTDKNGKKIFEGDIVESDNGRQSAIFVIQFGEYYPKMFYKMLDKFTPGKKHLPAVGFYGKSIDKGEEVILFQSQCVTVIGNIHDNPELLEETT